MSAIVGTSLATVYAFKDEANRTKYRWKSLRDGKFIKSAKSWFYQNDAVKSARKSGMEVKIEVHQE